MERSFYSTNYGRIVFDLAFGCMAIWALHDSKAPWLGYSILGVVVVFTIVVQSQTWIRADGITVRYFLRPFLRHDFIPIDALRSVEWKSGAYATSSFARIKYDRAANTATIGVIVCRSDWPRVIDILKEGKPSITVIDR